MCFYRSRRFVSASLCVVLTTVFCLCNLLLPQPAYAQIGADIKNTWKNLPYYQRTAEFTETEAKEYETHLDSLDFKFAVPDAYRRSGDGTVLDLSNVYLSKINPYETRDMWLSACVEERVAFSQIPETLLHEMSTDELIVTCLNYNLLIDLMVCNSASEGFEALKKQYNGFAELLSRRDAGSRLLALYKAIDYNEFCKNDQKAYLRMTVIQALLTEKSILNALKDTEVNELVNASYEKAMQLLREGSPVFQYEADLRIGLICLYVKDPSVKKIVDHSESLTSMVNDTAKYVSLDDVSEEAIGRIAVAAAKRQNGS